MNSTRTLVDDETAVSAVIGVLLMVAVTVVLAGIASTFVFGLTDTSDPPPSATFSAEYDSRADPTGSGPANCNTGSDSDGVLELKHVDGDSFDAGQVTISGIDGSESESWTDCGSNIVASNGTVDAGDRVRIAVSREDTIRVTWRSEDGEKSTTLHRWDSPYS